MSAIKFDPRDRIDEYGIIKVIARSGGYIMARRPGLMPFVLTEKEWNKLPLFPVTFESKI